MRKKPLIRALAGNFHLELSVKYFIAGYFYRDTGDWLQMYRIMMREGGGRLSVQSKEFVHLRFAIECALKSLLAALSKRNEEAEKVYKVIRSCSHNLERLLAECSTRSDGKYRVVSPRFLPDLHRIEALGIGIRYELDFKTAYNKQTVAQLYGDGPVSGVILSQDFRNRTYREAVRLYRRAGNVLSKRLGKHGSMVAVNRTKVEDYLRKLMR